MRSGKILSARTEEGRTTLAIPILISQFYDKIKSRQGPLPSLGAAALNRYAAKVCAAKNGKTKARNAVFPNLFCVPFPQVGMGRWWHKRAENTATNDSGARSYLPSPGFSPSLRNAEYRLKSIVAVSTVTDGRGKYRSRKKNSAAAMTKKAKGLADFRARLKAIDPSSWPSEQKNDYRVVEAEMPAGTI